MANPLVSIVIPSYNQGKFIRETIDSVLAQDYRPIEIIVQDGASTDETLDVLRSYGEIPELQWTSEPDKGVVDAVNRALARVKGSIVAIQSSDDTYVPGAIRAAVDAFASDASLGLVYGDVEYIDAASRVTGRTNLPPWHLLSYLSKETFIPQPAAFFTKVAADRAGGWRADWSYAADADYYLRIATFAFARKLDRLLGQYRYHEEQRDRVGKRISDDWEKAVRAWLATSQPSGAMKRNALAGIHLTHAHYLSDSHWPRRTWHLYRALIASPAVLTRPDFPRRELIPARTPIWRVLSRVKRALGFKPRAT